MTKTAIQRRRFTVADYYKMADAGILMPSDRVELIHGEILKMSPIKSLHAGIVNKLASLLILALQGKAIVAIQNPLNIDADTEPEPDIVVARYRADSYTENHPTPEDVLLVIEVADTSLQYDRQVKVPLYAQAGIPEYWIVNIPEQQIAVFRQPVKGKFAVKESISPGGVAVCESITLQLPVEDLFPAENS